MQLGTKLAGLAAMALSSFVAPKLAGATWKLVTGKEPPSEEAGSRLSQILVFAALSAVMVAAFQHIADSLTGQLEAEAKSEELSEDKEA